MNYELLETIKDAFDSQIKNTYELRDEDSKESFLKKIVEKYPVNGKPMVDEINASNPSLVLDLGCGLNQYKSIINNLVGIDIIGVREDITADISDLSAHFADHTADVVLALGSINFGTEEVIAKQLAEVKRLLKAGGIAYFRANQNDHDKDHQGTLRYYDWSVEKVLEWADKFNFEVIGEVELKEGRPGVNDRMNREFVAKKRSNIRLFWKWKSL